jgi:hypothetical protein
MASLDRARAGKLERRDKREILKLSDAAKAVLDSLKSMIVDHVCRSDVNREMCEKILRRKLTYSVIIEALGATVQGDELLRLRLASKALELAVGEGAIILSLKKEVDRKISEIEGTGGLGEGEKEGRDAARSIDCTKNQEACKQFVEQSIGSLRRFFGE